MRISLGILLTIVCGKMLLGQDLPLGYINYYSNDFSKSTIDKSILFSAQSNYSVGKGVLKLNSKPDSGKTFTPSAAMVIDNNIFGDFVAQLRVKCLVESLDSLSGLYVIVGLKDSLNYYTIRLNTKGTSFCRIYKGVETLVQFQPDIYIDNNKWETLRIKRDILSRSIIVKFNETEFVFTDPNLVMGYLGFGVEDCGLELDKLNIWAPASIEKPAPLFNQNK